MKAGVNGGSREVKNLHSRYTPEKPDSRPDRCRPRLWIGPQKLKLSLWWSRRDLASLVIDLIPIPLAIPFGRGRRREEERIMRRSKKKNHKITNQQLKDAQSLAWRPSFNTLWTLQLHFHDANSSKSARTPLPSNSSTKPSSICSVLVPPYRW